VKFIDDLLESVAHLDGPVKRVCVGLHWTVVQSNYTGMAHTFRGNHKVELTSSGDLLGKSALKTARRLKSWEPLEASLGLAALNSLIEPAGTPGNAFEYLLTPAQGKTVTIVGRFPSNDQVARVARKVYFLELEPTTGELPSSACEEVIPQSDLVVITATALINKTLPRLLELSQHATTIVLGPSTPMNEVMFRYGANLLAGVRVTDTDELISSVMQGVKKFSKLAGIEPVMSLASD